MRRRRRRNAVDHLATHAPGSGRGSPLTAGEKAIMGGAFLLGIAATYAFWKQVTAKGGGAPPPLPKPPGSWGAPGYKAPPPGTPPTAWGDSAMAPGTPGGDSAPVPPEQYASQPAGDEDMARAYQEQGGGAFAHN